MSKKVHLFKRKESMNRSNLSAFLHQLADHVAQGNILLRPDEGEISLALSDILTLEIEAEDKDKKRKGVQHSLELEIKWFDEEPLLEESPSKVEESAKYEKTAEAVPEESELPKAQEE